MNKIKIENYNYGDEASLELRYPDNTEMSIAELGLYMYNFIGQKYTVKTKERTICIYGYQSEHDIATIFAFTSEEIAKKYPLLMCKLLKKLIAEAFENGNRRVQAFVVPENTVSINWLMYTGKMKLEGYLRGVAPDGSDRFILGLKRGDLCQ